MAKLGRVQMAEIPEEVSDVLATDLLSEAPDLPRLVKELRKAIIVLQKRENEIEAFAAKRAKDSVGLTLKFTSRTTGRGDYLDRLGVGRKEVTIYRNGKWEAVKSAGIEGFMLQFLDENQFKRWLYAYKLRLSLLYIYFYLGKILERLGVIEFV